MKALVKATAGSGGVELRDVPEPRVREGEARIRIKAAGICGSDLHVFRGEMACSPPVIMGHELCGEVVDVGSAAFRFRPGDRVTAETVVSWCGTCRMCRSGNHFLCPRRTALGYHVDGVFAEYKCLREELLHRIPDGLSFQEGALFEPLVCCVHCVLERAKVAPVAKVLISGPGTIGLLALQVVKSTGAFAVVTGLPADAPKLKSAETLGADAVVVQEGSDPFSEIMRITDGEGVDTSVEAAGAAASLETCVRLTARKGTVVQVGLFGKRIPVDFDSLVTKEINVVTSMSQSRSAWKEALRLVQTGKVALKPLISRVLSLSQWERAFAMAERREGVKILFDPQL